VRRHFEGAITDEDRPKNSNRRDGGILRHLGDGLQQINGA
jgi:hypothetical protein